MSETTECSKKEQAPDLGSQSQQFCVIATGMIRDDDDE